MREQIVVINFLSPLLSWRLTEITLIAKSLLQTVSLCIWWTLSAWVICGFCRLRWMTVWVKRCMCWVVMRWVQTCTVYWAQPSLDIRLVQRPWAPSVRPSGSPAVCQAWWVFPTPACLGPCEICFIFSWILL